MLIPNVALDLDKLLWENLFLFGLKFVRSQWAESLIKNVENFKKLAIVIVNKRISEFYPCSLL
jgi:hypothetical protein